MIYDAVVIGAGASGMMAAAAAAKSGARVCVMEADMRAGRKILVTGNGKCNLTNRRLDASCYRSDSLPLYDRNCIMKIINRFDNEAVIRFFYEEGLLTRERDGYVYPYSEQASSVLDTLRRALEKYKAALICGCQVERIEKNENGFFILDAVVADASVYGEASFDGKESRTSSRRRFQGRTLILATGSAAGMPKSRCAFGYQFARKTGHHVIKPLPALVQLICQETYCKELAGVRAKGALRLYCGGTLLAQDAGEIQFTDRGISGIPVFQVSRHAVRALEKKRGKITADIDFMPEYGEPELKAYIEKLLSDGQTLSLFERLTGLVNKKVMGLIIKLSGANVADMATLLKKFTVTVTGSKGPDTAQVCQGGVRLDEIDADTMESRLVKGLYFCGEILDVDGICGGYNLQWAFSSGHLAGEGAAGQKRKEERNDSDSSDKGAAGGIA